MTPRKRPMLAVLQAIGEIAVDMTVGAEAFLAAGYGASLGRMEREERAIRKRNAANIAPKIAEAKLLAQYYNLLYRLRKDGLIEQRKNDGSLFLRLTTRGKDKLATLLHNSAERLPVPQYTSVPGKTFTIVTFDIPERERHKRIWLRKTLRNLQFHQVQQSVYLGKAKIPRDLIEDLRTLRLVSCVEIFEITKGGSLRHIA